MKDDHFDDMLRKKLAGFASNVPADMWQRISDRKRRRKKSLVIFRISMFAIFMLLMIIGYNHLFVRSGDKWNKTTMGNVIGKQNSTDLNNNKENKVSSKDNTLKNSSLMPADTGTFKRYFAYPDGNKNAVYRNRKNHKNSYDHSVANVTPLMKENEKRDDSAEADHHKINDTTASSKKPIINADTTSSQNKEKPESETHDKFSIELFGSPFYPVNNIRSSNTAYEQLLKNSTAVQLSAAFGIRFQYAITDRISAKIGLTYSNVSEKINFKNSANGQQFRETDHYQFLEVPLLISYSMPLPNSISAAVNAGIVVNISSKFKGAIPSPSGEPIGIATTNVYYSNKGGGLYVSVDLSKNIGHKIYFFVEPYFQRSFKNMANTFQNFKQKIHFAGINFGVGYNFF